MGVLSEIDSQAPCYPAFPQAAWLRKGHRDGVNCGESRKVTAAALGIYMLAGSTAGS